MTLGAVDEISVAPRSGWPAVDVLSGGEPCLVSADVSGDIRWLEFADEAERIGARSMLAVRLATDEDGTLGSLALFAPVPDAFGPGEAVRLGPIATQASIALSAIYNREQVEHLHRALETNRDIAVAIGIVMAHRVIGREAAFDLLRAASQHLHRKMADLALDVVNSGVLEFPPGGYSQWVRR